MLNSSVFRFAIWVLLLLVIALVSSMVPFVFSPLVIVFRAVFAPVLIAGLLYYWLSPVVERLCGLKVPRGVGIIAVFGVILGLLVLIVLLTGPPLQRQATSLIGNAPALLESLRLRLLELEKNVWVVRLAGTEALALDELVNQFTTLISSLLASIGQNLTPIIGMTTDIITVMFLVPFLLFYMLYDGAKLSPTLVKFLLPPALYGRGREILSNMDKALRTYVQGQALISLSVGFLAFVGYLVIGLEYALLLALVMAVTNIVPFVGVIIGSIPALIVGIVASPGMFWLALIVIIIVQQIEGMLISPRIMGKKLSSHPLAVLFVIIIAGNLAGFWGILLAVPTFAVLKVTLGHLYALGLLYWQLRSPADTPPPQG